MKPFQPFLCISASAGSGKTFQLSHRVLRLLAMGAAPDELGAYTFSRKAAGEIFDSIVGYLQKAARDGDQAAVTSAHMGLERNRSAFCQDLRTLLDHLHRLRIGTLDARISRMLSVSAIEIGLPVDFQIMDAQSADYLRRQDRILQSLFHSGQLTDADADTFLRLFLEATHGQAEKSFRRQIEDILHTYRPAFQAHPHPGDWQGLFLPDMPDVLNETERDDAREKVRQAAGALNDKRVIKGLHTLADACASFDQTSLWSRDKPKGKIWEQLSTGDEPVFIFSGKEFHLPSPAGEALMRLVGHVPATVWEQTRRRTQALWGFLAAYEAGHRDHMLPGGTLSFDDACRLMAGFDRIAPADLAYRLDGEIHHWLLDEFQDTNRAQWQVLRPFLDEILQDPEQRRSFFYVGDVKQAIYGWRGGDSSLFTELLETWPHIERINMDRSFRSARPVLDLVNHLLDRIPVIEGLPEEAFTRWNREFSPHVPANKDQAGRAEVLQLQDPGMAEGIRNLVDTLPLEGDTAILVRSNAQGEEIAHTLRSAGHHVSLEGKSEVRDDLAVETVLAAVTLAAHPGDAGSDRLVRMAGLEVDPFNLLRRIREHGLTPAVRELSARIPLNEHAGFSRRRLHRLIDLALEFDTRGDPSPDAFLAHVDTAHIKENEARGVIRIMTVHQSKGLGFDTVIVPIKSGSSLGGVDTGSLVACQDPDGSDRVTLLPPNDICRALPILRDLHQQEEAKTVYENLCVLYVALTRAKTSLHVILDTPPKNEGSPTVLHNWLAARVESLPAETGDEPAGLKRLAAFGTPRPSGEAAADGVTRPEPAPFPLPSGQRTLPRLEPSREDGATRSAASLFRFVPQDGRDLGSAVHAVLEQVVWADDINPDHLLKEAGIATDSAVADHVRRALAFQAMQRPADALDLWRERKFETVLEEGWVTGVFDRVVFCKNEIRIQDFKTNRNPTDATAEHYAPQMRLYRRVLADMMKVDESSIRCQLLFTADGSLKEVA